MRDKKRNLKNDFRRIKRNMRAEFNNALRRIAGSKPRATTFDAEKLLETIFSVCYGKCDTEQQQHCLGLPWIFRKEIKVFLEKKQFPITRQSYCTVDVVSLLVSNDFKNGILYRYLELHNDKLTAQLASRFDWFHISLSFFMLWLIPLISCDDRFQRVEEIQRFATGYIEICERLKEENKIVPSSSFANVLSVIGIDYAYKENKKKVKNKSLSYRSLNKTQREFMSDETATNVIVHVFKELAKESKSQFDEAILTPKVISTAQEHVIDLGVGRTLHLNEKPTHLISNPDEMWVKRVVVEKTVYDSLMPNMFDGISIKKGYSQ